MLKKLAPHLLLALAFTLLTLGQQYLFFYTHKLPIVYLSLGKYLGIYLFLLVATFNGSNFSKLFWLSLVMVLNYFQFGHLYYYGTQILPSEVGLLVQTEEIVGVLREDAPQILLNLVYVVVPVGLGIWLCSRLKPQFKFKTLSLLFCLYFIYNPIRTFVTGNTWGRQPSTRELTGMNVYLSFSYFMGRILPHRLQHDADHTVINSSQKLTYTEGTQTDWDKIIVILGESLAPGHMSLYGYRRPTTPYLSGLKQDPNFLSLKGISSGVSTDVSVAFFMNLGFSDAGRSKASKGEHCLFKMAKKHGYGTHFLSIQSEEQLRYITPFVCLASLDDSRSMEDIAPEVQNHMAAPDDRLLPQLEKLIAQPGRKFIMLHQRGSHAPWSLRFTEAANKFKPDPEEDSRVALYDNSVYEFDLFWKSMDTMLKHHKEKVLVAYISDHGEALGEEGRWGHGILHQQAIEVPVLYQSYNRPLPEALKKFTPFTTQYNFSLLLLQEMGYALNQKPEENIPDFAVYGNDMDGFAGKAPVTFKDDKYDFKVEL